MGSPSSNRYFGFEFSFIVLQFTGLILITLMSCWVSFFLGGVSWSSNLSTEFNWHPLLMTIGMVFLYGNSILVYRGFRNVRKPTLKLIHASLFALVLILAIIAAWAVFDTHNLANPPTANLYTLHSWMGLGSMILFILQWMGGFFSFLCSCMPVQLRAAIMPKHIYFGLLGYILAVVSALLGLCEKGIWKLGSNYSKLPQEALMVNAMGILMVAFAAHVVYLATNLNFKRIPLPIDIMA